MTTGVLIPCSHLLLLLLRACNDWFMLGGFDGFIYFLLLLLLLLLLWLWLSYY